MDTLSHVRIGITVPWADVPLARSNKPCRPQDRRPAPAASTSANRRHLKRSACERAQTRGLVYKSLLSLLPTFPFLFIPKSYQRIDHGALRKRHHIRSPKKPPSGGVRPLRLGRSSDGWVAVCPTGGGSGRHSWWAARISCSGPEPLGETPGATQALAALACCRVVGAERPLPSWLSVAVWRFTSMTASNSLRMVWRTTTWLLRILDRSGPGASEKDRYMVLATVT
ncbi:hypothetical protein BKA80DRAFT_13341 [Phyllosticta citrichinensis]